MAERIPTLATIVAQVPDPRARRGQRHPWTALLLLVIAGLLSGANSQQALARWSEHIGWRRRRQLGFRRRSAPSAATVHRVLRTIDVAALESIVGHWQQHVRAAWYRHANWLDGIAIDGKSLRTARRLGAQDGHLLSACCQCWGQVLGQTAVPDATSELGAIGPLLNQLLLARETVTFDAAFTHSLVAEQVVAQGGAYLMVIKANQPTLLRACAEATAEHPKRPRRPLGQTHATTLAHGRIERRTLLTVRAPADLGFPHARQVLRLDRRVISKQTGQVLHEETVYGVTSLSSEQASPSELLELWRRHWRVESLHWLRDAVFGEDRSTIHVGHAHQAFAAFRNLAISLIHRWRGSQVTAAREYYASHPAVLLRRLGLTPAGTLK